MELEKTLSYTEACFHGEFASCTYACPLHLDIRAFMDHMQRGSWSSAYRILRSAMIFPDIVASLCHGPCREHCIRKFSDDPLAVGDIERACLANVKSKEPEAYHLPVKKQRVAVVGAGASGLACALRLAVKKYQVTVYDSAEGYGGSLRGHSQADLFLEDIARQLQNEEITFCFNSLIASLEGLDFDAIYIATGVGGDVFGLRDGWDSLTLATEKPGCFLGGMVTGATIIEAIEQGSRASKQIEKYLQTGEVADYKDEYPREKCDRYTPEDSIAATPRTKMASSGGYTAEEAVTEANRCLKCNCTACIDACQMLTEFRKKPKQIARDVYNDSAAVGGFSSRSVTRLVSSCNLCGDCRAQCPNKVDLGGLNLFSRRDRVRTNTYPAAFHDFWIKEMEFAFTKGSIYQPPRGKDRCSYVFFPGCQLGASNVDYVKKSYAYLQQQFNGDVGMMLSCCGAPAYWAGDEELHQKVNAELKIRWRELGQPAVIFACATCAKLWNQFLPEAEGLSLYEIMRDKGIETKEPAILQAAIFDPCAARDDPRMRESVRALTTIAGIDFRELPFHGEKAKCCGWGGHIQAANGKLYDRIVDSRIAAHTAPYIVYCANCRDVFAAKGKQSMHILDVVFSLDDGLRKAPVISEKRKNSLRLKGELLKECWNLDFRPEERPYDAVQITIAPELVAKMESELISETRVKAAIWRAEESGNKFLDLKSQTYICNDSSGDATTCWIRYSRPAPQKYLLHNVYCHRMSYFEGLQNSSNELKKG